MATATADMVQVNVRVRSDVKRAAEAELEQVGSSVSALVRVVLEKVARSPKDCLEVTNLLEEDDPEVAERLALVHDGWKVADDFYRSLGVDPETMPKDTRSWDEVYEEAMTEHFREKGYFQ